MKRVYSFQYLFYHLFYIWQAFPWSHKHGDRSQDSSQFIQKVVIKYCFKAIIIWRYIIQIYFDYFMISSKDASSSHRLKSSLDISFLLRILLRNSVVAALEVVSLVWSFSYLFFFSFLFLFFFFFFRFENVLRTARIF